MSGTFDQIRGTSGFRDLCSIVWDDSDASPYGWCVQTGASAKLALIFLTGRNVRETPHVWNSKHACLEFQTRTNVWCLELQTRTTHGCTMFGIPNIVFGTIPYKKSFQKAWLSLEKEVFWPLFLSDGIHWTDVFCLLQAALLIGKELLLKILNREYGVGNMNACVVRRLHFQQKEQNNSNKNILKKTIHFSSLRIHPQN